MICHVFKQRRRIDGELTEAASWSGRLKMPWETSVSTVALNTPDKRLALFKLSQLAEEREKEHNGVLAPKPVREAAERPLLDLLSEYLQDVESRGRAITTVKKYRKILRKLFARCRWLKLQDVTARSFCQWRNQCGLTGKTTNDLLACATTFFDWLEGQRMLTANPLKYVKRTDTRGQAQFRRALSQTEVANLLSHAPHSRAVVYLAAIYTGLRRKELNNLKWGDLHLDAPQPFVLAPASITKNKKDARLPLRPEVVEALRSIRPADASPFQFVFNGQVPRVKTLRKDLSRAGIIFIDESGRRLDFHALRNTFGTLLAVNHVPLTDAVHLMRHSDPKLTMKIYTDASQLALSDSLAKLPSLVVCVGQRAS
ncbi:tyrosine-type recombinase/integrase [Opitutus sp. GAS368]|uniref:tyrosine-type recombinase/integrase n=1 Tax=Opitutus sp. GAS368 TaxID=1882749 RepID=UPI000B84FE3D|nr:tyrosine-type recombinase/integrase [Opitutus sp. GAS368]